MNGLFLSYARADDEPFVRRLHRDLSDHALDVWLDRESMPSRGLQFTAEIERAIAERDRFLLIVGPHALASDYVGGEWRCAIRLGKAITPIVRVGSPADLPAELRLLDARDFTDDHRYAAELSRLLEQIAEPLAPMGRLIGVPALPPHFIEQPDRLAALKEALRADLLRPDRTAGAALRAGVSGMGGIGKSVLACVAANDAEVRRLFPDGIIWVPVGHEADLVRLLRGVVRALGEEPTFADEHEGRARVGELLANRAVLLILDDVWDRAVAEAFHIGPRCRLLITTRDASLVTALGGCEYQVQLPTFGEASAILAEWSGHALPLPNDAAAVIRACGRLPLALAICGAMVRDGTPWQDLLDALREADLAFLEHEQGVAGYEHRSVFAAIKVGVDALPESERARWGELAVFPPDRPTPEDAILTLWARTGPLAERDGRKLLAKLERRSLLLAEADESPSRGARRRVLLHDLLHAFAARQHDDLTVLHRALLDAYAAKCPSGWASGPNDGYFLSELARHLVAAQRGGELADLLGNFDWAQTKVDAGLCLDLPDECRAAVREAPSHPYAQLLPLLARAVGRDAAFITAHPALLLQCLWHTCWWHDAPEAEPFYDWVGTGAAGAEPAWRRASPTLHALMNEWRERAMTRPSRGCWLRSRRPPVVPLESPLLAEIPSSGAFASAVVAITSDGSRAAGGGTDGTVHLWDAASGRELLVMRRTLATGLVAIAMSSDGARIATGHDDGAVVLWDAVDGRAVLELPGAGTPLRSAGPVGIVSADGVETLPAAATPAFSIVRQPLALSVPAGDAGFAAVFIDGTLVRAHGEEKQRTMTLPSDEGLLRHAAVSADGQVVATYCSGREVRVWDVGGEGAAPREVCAIRATDSFVSAIALSASGDRLAVSTDGGAIRLFDTATGAEVRSLAPEQPAQSLAFSGDCRHMVAAFWQGTVRVWNVASGSLEATFDGHETGSNRVALSADGKTIVSGSERAVRVWDASVAAALTLRDPFRIAAVGADFILVSDQGRIVFAASDTVYAIDAGSVETRLLFGPIESVIAAIASSRDGRIAAIADWDGEISVIHVERGQRLHTVRVEGVEYPDSSVGSLVVTTDGATVVTSSEELGLSAWDMVTGHRLWTDEAGESWWLGLALTEDESCVLVAEDEERRVRRRLADGELVGEEERSAGLDSEKRFAWAGGSVISSRSGAHACVHLEQQIIPVQVEGAPRGC